MKRVLFLIPTLRGGGAERVMVTLLRNLDASAFCSTLVVVDGADDVFRKELPPNLDVVDLGAARVRYALPRLVKLIRRTKPDVVFSTLGHLNLAIALVRPFLPDEARYVARETVVVTENLRASSHPRIWRWLYRSCYGRFDRVICQSQDMHDDLVGRLGLPASLATVINNPVDVDRIAARAREPLPYAVWPRSGGKLRLLAAGRLVEQKGFDLLIEALARLPDASVMLVILGEGPLRGVLELLAQRLGIADRVVFAGFQHNPYPFFTAADAFVLSSRYEGLPNVVLESLACGTPVVATPAPGGVREILAGVPECVIAESVSAPALAQAIERWRAMPRTRVPAERIAPYKLQRIVHQYEAALNSSPLQLSSETARE